MANAKNSSRKENNKEKLFSTHNSWDVTGLVPQGIASSVASKR